MVLSVNEASPFYGAGPGLDTLAVLRASQTLSAERSAPRLWARVESVLRTMAGATKVVLALWDEEGNDWVLPTVEDETSAEPSAAKRVALSVLRHAPLTAEPLRVPDVLRDPRFSDDPYFEYMPHCSVMVVPMQRRGVAHAILVLENRADPNGFSLTQLEAATIVAGQLAIALDNARLFERLEGKVTEQSQQLHETQVRLNAETERAGMAEIATNVLHNVGNVLTSVNFSAHVLTKQVQHSPATRVGDLAQLLSEQAGDLEAFFAPGGKGRLLPGYLRELGEALGTEREQLLAELQRLSGSVEHIKNVIAMQQSYAVGHQLETASMTSIVDDALNMQQASMQRHAVQVRKSYGQIQLVPLDKTRVMQILVNLIENARQAMDDLPGERIMEIGVRQGEAGLEVSVADNGCGMAPETLENLFAHGFTTKADGHGFGLHSCAAAAREMGGSLTARSEGPGKGATFVLRLPGP
jgi:signal transduction histidine kinase